jgi:hypothetical protein
MPTGTTLDEIIRMGASSFVAHVWDLVGQFLTHLDDGDSVKADETLRELKKYYRRAIQEHEADLRTMRNYMEGSR